MKASIILFFVLFSQLTMAQVKINYDKKSSLNKNTNLVKLKADDTDKAVLVFTTGYWGDAVKIKIGDKTFTKGVLTIPELGYAGVQVINNGGDVEITFNDGTNIRVTLKHIDLKTYKYAYISKGTSVDNSKVQITMSNDAKYTF